MDGSLPGSSVHGVFQAVVLEWIAISFSKESSRPRDRTRVSHIVDRRFTICNLSQSQTWLSNFHFHLYLNKDKKKKRLKQRKDIERIDCSAAGVSDPPRLFFPSQTELSSCELGELLCFGEFSCDSLSHELVFCTTWTALMILRNKGGKDGENTLFHFDFWSQACIYGSYNSPVPPPPFMFHNHFQQSMPLCGSSSLMHAGGLLLYQQWIRRVYTA